MTDLERIQAALDAVIALHRPRQFNAITDGVYFGQTEFDHNICAHDHERWPCLTIEAITNALGNP